MERVKAEKELQLQPSQPLFILRVAAAGSEHGRRQPTQFTEWSSASQEASWSQAESRCCRHKHFSNQQCFLSASHLETGDTTRLRGQDDTVANSLEGNEAGNPPISQLDDRHLFSRAAEHVELELELELVPPDTGGKAGCTQDSSPVRHGLNICRALLSVLHLTERPTSSHEAGQSVLMVHGCQSSSLLGLSQQAIRARRGDGSGEPGSTLGTIRQSVSCSAVSSGGSWVGCRDLGVGTGFIYLKNKCIEEISRLHA
ncbi:unnamed protein product [Pleuronectes platessa]|uniref:Uncharacterized protein n=1 Tax=Pleuronectes platessa TaxID=8262 RepID=A0A9N7TM33_PLEPL|nr:unnamed protein product [Pleuronectes platessa]